MKKISTLLFVCCFSLHLADGLDAAEKQPIVPTDTTIYTKVDVSAKFPGGEAKWNEFVKAKIFENANALVDDPESRGVCTLQFVVNTDGTISNIKPLNLHGTELARVFVKAIRTGSKWLPAELNGQKVRSVMTQKVTFLTR